MTREETHYETYLRERGDHAEQRAKKAEAAIDRAVRLAANRERRVGSPDVPAISVSDLLHALDGDQ